MLDAALAYAARGWKIMPVWSTDGRACACPRGSTCPTPGKHPVSDHGLTDATSATPQVHAWWSTHPGASIGVMLRGSGLVAFDVDLYKDDQEKTAALEVELGALPQTTTQVSGSGEGMHLVYAHPRGDDGQLVDVRGSIGGVTLRSRAYIILDPSLHASGGRYRWREGRSPDDAPPAELPEMWRRALTRPVAGVGSVGVPPADTEPDWLRAIPDHVREGLMREHMGREHGERKGDGRPGQAYNVMRTCARGYAVRDPRRVFDAAMTIYNTKCMPPYDGHAIGRRVDSAYETAESPEWGAMLRPPDLARAELGLAPRVVPPPVADQKPAAAEIPDQKPAEPDPWAAAEVAPPASSPTDGAWPDEPGGDWPDLFGPRSGAVGGFAPSASALADIAAARRARIKVGRRAVHAVTKIIEESRLPLVSTPYRNLNDKIGGGLPVHSNNILVAPSGKGKSSMAGDFAAFHAASSPAIYYVGEMTEALMTARIIGQRLSRSWADVVRARVTEEEMRAVLDPLHLYMVERSDHPLDAIRETVVLAMADLGGRPDPDHPGHWIREDGTPHPAVPLVIIDYIQLLASLEGDNVRVATARAVREVQRYFEDTVAVGLTLSQTSRENSAKIRDGVARAEELAGVGAETAELERSATYQFVLSYQSKDDVELHEVNFTIAKGRFGGGSRIGLTFNGRTGQWAEMDAPPTTEDEAERCAEILAQLSAHSDNACLAGASCGRAVTSAALTKHPHKVSGPRPKIEAALRRLEQQGLVRRSGSSYAIAGRGGGEPAA